MSAPTPEDELHWIKLSIFKGEKIKAIKDYRELKGVGLRDAKDAVEKLESELRASSPEKFTSAPAGKGCMGVVAGVAMVVVVMVGIILALR